MNENDWQTTNDPRMFYHVLLHKATTRQARLFACAWARYVAHDLLDPASRAMIGVAERCADGLGSRDQLTAARRAALAAAEATGNPAAVAARNATRISPFGAALCAGHVGPDWDGRVSELERWWVLLRCIVGDPFRPLPALPGVFLLVRRSW
jgi:hypothetical protein